MRILFDLAATQPIGNTKFHGGGEYCKIIFKKVVELHGSDDLIDIFYNSNKSIDNELKEICEKFKFKMIICNNNEELTKLLLEGQYDIFYSGLPYNYMDISIPKITKFIFTIHGLRCMEMPYDSIRNEYSSATWKKQVKKLRCIIDKNYKMREYYAQKQQISKLLNVTKNRIILTDSIHSKYSMLYFFPELQNQEIKVYYAPQKDKSQIRQDNDKKILNNLGLSFKKYILLISGNRWEKNVVRAVKALDYLFSQNYTELNNTCVVVLGVTDKDMYRRQISHSEYFTLKDYVSTEELEALYRNAYIFLYPTLNEGFGYPPIEAMKYRTICACSAITSVPEVCENAVLYFNPFDVNEIANRVLQCFDFDVRNNLKVKMDLRYPIIEQMQNDALNEIALLILGRNNN